MLMDLASTVILRSESLGTHEQILLSQIGDFPNVEGQIPVFISPRNKVHQLYPHALGSIFVAPYDSQGYGGSIRPRLHTWLVASLCNLDTDRIENTCSRYISIVVSRVAAAIMSQHQRKDGSVYFP
jgi:hypothetical protein